MSWISRFRRSGVLACAVSVCVVAVTAPPASASVIAREAPVGRVAGSSDCVEALTCSLEVINGWGVERRARWFRDLRSRLDSEIAPGAGAAFENIQDVLRLSLQKGFDDHPWFLMVDAGIIEGIEAGFALASGRASPSANWGRVRWKEYFDAFRRGESTDRLNRLWGEAEQAATNYGIQRAREAGHTLGHSGRDDRIRFALIEVGNTYRQNLVRTSTRSTSAFWRVCDAPANLLELFTGFVLRVATTICASVRGFFSVLGPSAILTLGGFAYDSVEWLRPVASWMGLFDYDADGLWDPSVAVP